MFSCGESIAHDRSPRLIGKAGTGALVQWLKLPAWEVEPHSGLRVSKKQNGFSSLTRKDSLFWETSVTDRYSVLSLRSPGLEFRILSLDGNVISFISPSSGSSPGPAYPIFAQRWPNVPFISFHLERGFVVKATCFKNRRSRFQTCPD